MINYIHYKIWDEIIHSFPNVDGAVVADQKDQTLGPADIKGRDGRETCT